MLDPLGYYRQTYFGYWQVMVKKENVRNEKKIQAMKLKVLPHITWYFASFYFSLFRILHEFELLRTVYLSLRWYKKYFVILYDSKI